MSLLSTCTLCIICNIYICIIPFTITITGIQKANQDKTRQSQDNIDGEWKWLKVLQDMDLKSPVLELGLGIRVRELHVGLGNQGYGIKVTE